MAAERLSGSFRDPSGYVFSEGNRLFRRITEAGKTDFSRFTGSGLAEKLVREGKLVPFEPSAGDETLLELEKLPFITYPYEWSFSQLRDAALLTLDLAREALRHDMVLKDASAFNVAFREGRPVFMDHTSFAAYRENEPWCAYRQFVMHFLAPLLLMRKCDLRCLGLFREDLGGIPLELASRLLPWYTRLSPGILLHIHLHAAFDKRCSEVPGEARQATLSRKQFENMLDSMIDFTGGLHFPRQKTAWAQYTGTTSYEENSFLFKQQCVDAFCRDSAPEVCLDLGANSGVFSEIAARYARHVVAADIDPCAVEHLYRLNRERVPGLVPVLQDLNNPSPALGVFNTERDSFFARFRGDLVLGLALIHHLRITGNWSLEQIAELFARLAPKALVEFVPREDPQVKQLLRGREEYCPDWTLGEVCRAFAQKYGTCERIPIPGSCRTLLRLN